MECGFDGYVSNPIESYLMISDIPSPFMSWQRNPELVSSSFPGPIAVLAPNVPSPLEKYVVHAF